MRPASRRWRTPRQFVGGCCVRLNGPSARPIRSVARRRLTATVPLQAFRQSRDHRRALRRHRSWQDQDTRSDRLVDLGARPHLLSDRHAQLPDCRLELAVDLRHRQSHCPSDHAGRTAAEATVGRQAVRPAVGYPDAPGNLFEPVTGAYGARGRFDDRARTASRERWPPAATTRPYRRGRWWAWPSALTFWPGG